VAKSPEAFRTISEASSELGVPQHVLRFWETRFSFVRPMKRAGGRRFYRPQDIAVLALIRRLLHEEGYTIKGVQKLHRQQGLKRLAMGEASPPTTVYDEGLFAASAGPEVSDDANHRLRATLAELEQAKARLDALLR
jgi:DNA-binding transcriptional MerR regulator